MFHCCSSVKYTLPLCCKPTEFFNMFIHTDLKATAHIATKNYISFDSARITAAWVDLALIILLLAPLNAIPTAFAMSPHCSENRQILRPLLSNMTWYRPLTDGLLGILYNNAFGSSTSPALLCCIKCNRLTCPPRTYAPAWYHPSYCTNVRSKTSIWLWNTDIIIPVFTKWRELL